MSKTSEFRELRLRVLARDSNRCTECGRGSRNGLHEVGFDQVQVWTDSLQVHHIIPVKEGGTDEETNLRTMCTLCHSAIHRKLRDDLLEQAGQQPVGEGDA